MKIKTTLLAGSVLASLAALSSFAQVADGSNASRARLPQSRPADYVRVIKAGSAHSMLVASHLGGPAPRNLVAVAPKPLVTEPVTASAASKNAAAARVASSRRE